MKKYLNILLIPMFIFTMSCEKEEEPEPDDCAGVSGGTNICACTDEEALNYDATATFDDGSCEYDETAPNVDVLVTDGSVLEGNVEVEVFAWDAVGIDKLTLFRNATGYSDMWVQIGVQDGKSSSGYDFNWNTNNVPNGDYMLKAVATDDRGNEGTSDVVSVVVTNFVYVTFNNNLHTEMLYNFNGEEGLFNALSSNIIKVNKNQGQVLFQGVAGMSCGDVPVYEGYITIGTSNITENLDVESNYFFLYVNNNSGYTMNDIIVNRGLVAEVSCSDITIPSDASTYQVGYFVAGSNSNVSSYTDANTSIYWEVDPIPLTFTLNQSFTLNLGGGRMILERTDSDEPRTLKQLEGHRKSSGGGIIMTETITPK